LPVGYGGSMTVGQLSPTTGRAARRRDRRKSEIVGVALKILATSGYQGMSLEEVAQEADIAKATLYHYFPGKDALVTAALEALTTDVLDRLRTEVAAASDRSAYEQLQVLVAEQLHVLTELYPEVGKLFSFPTSWPQEHGQSMKSMRRRHDEIFRVVVERGVASGDFDCPDPGVALHCLQGLLNHASVWLRPANDPDGARARAVIDAGMRLFAR
jgi:TetR/AcrR family transcriptional regulator of autoinduction and epiphytic fitness